MIERERMKGREKERERKKKREREKAIERYLKKELQENRVRSV